MANSPSAKKSVRQIERRTAVNKSRRTQMKTFVRKAEEAIEVGEKITTIEALRAAQGKLARAAQKGIIHANAAARKIARLTARAKTITA